MMSFGRSILLKMRIVIPFTGGLKSTRMLIESLSKGYQVHALYVDNLYDENGKREADICMNLIKNLLDIDGNNLCSIVLGRPVHWNITILHKPERISCLKYSSDVTPMTILMEMALQLMIAEHCDAILWSVPQFPPTNVYTNFIIHESTTIEDDFSYLCDLQNAVWDGESAILPKDYDIFNNITRCTLSPSNHTMAMNDCDVLLDNTCDSCDKCYELIRLYADEKCIPFNDSKRTFDDLAQRDTKRRKKYIS